MTESNTNHADIDVSIIVPCYKEEGHLRDSFTEIYKTMSATSLRWEIIFVEDCGPDNTRDIILELANEYDMVRYIFHDKNKGRGGAVKTGMAAARGRVAGFLDIDLEVHCRYIPAMVQTVDDGADIVCGYRIYKVPITVDDLFRDFISFCYRVLIRSLLKVRVHDTEAGYKFFNLQRISPLIELTDSEGWFWDSEIMALSTYRGFNVSEMPMVYIRNPEKETTVNPIRDSMEMFRGLMAFRRKYRPSIIYKYPRLYHSMMKLIYRDNYDERYRMIAEEIPEGASVLDVCCGDAYIYDGFLSNKSISYRGLDILPNFVENARTRGIDAGYCDIELMDLPQTADVVIMQGSLYQFIPGQALVLEKLLKAAGKKVIITEAVSNWSSSGNPVLRKLGHSGTNPGTGPKTERFSPETLDGFLSGYNILKKSSLCGGREMMYVLDASN